MSGYHSDPADIDRSVVDAIKTWTAAETEAFFQGILVPSTTADIHHPRYTSSSRPETDNSIAKVKISGATGSCVTTSTALYWPAQIHTFCTPITTSRGRKNPPASKEPATAHAARA